MTPRPDVDRALARHDWLFEFSDDHQVWRRGTDALNRLAAIAKESFDHEALFNAYNAAKLYPFSYTEKLLHELRQRLGLPPAP